MAPQGWSTTPGIWIGAIGTLALFSLIYRENRIYRIFEHIFVGLAAGFLIKYTWSDVLYPQWWKPMAVDGQWPWIFALFIGLMYYTIYSKKYSWMSRLALGILFGLVAGQIFQQTANDYVPQIAATFKPLWITPSMVPKGSGLTTYGLALSNLLFVAIVLTVLAYFFFSFEQKNKAVIRTARVGRLMMMVAFGAIFGSTVMARMALLIDRVWFLMHNWLKVA